MKRWLPVVAACVALASNEALACGGFGFGFGFGLGGFKVWGGNRSWGCGGPVYAPVPVVVAPAPTVTVVMPPPQVVYQYQVPTAVPVAPLLAPVAVEPQVSAPPLPPMMAVAAPPPYRAPANAPAPVPAPPASAASVRREQEPPPAPERAPLFAAKYTPGASFLLSDVGRTPFSDISLVHGVGVEVRVTRWLALRSDATFGRDLLWDVVGVKLSPFTEWTFRPYISAGATAVFEGYSNRFSISGVGALGFNIFFGKHFFLEAEARVRPPTGCCSAVPSLGGMVGAGVAFL